GDSTQWEEPTRRRGRSDSRGPGMDWRAIRLYQPPNELRLLMQTKADAITRRSLTSRKERKQANETDGAERDPDLAGRGAGCRRESLPNQERGSGRR